MIMFGVPYVYTQSRILKVSCTWGHVSWALPHLGLVWSGKGWPG